MSRGQGAFAMTRTLVPQPLPGDTGLASAAVTQLDVAPDGVTAVAIDAHGLAWQVRLDTGAVGWRLPALVRDQVAAVLPGHARLLVAGQGSQLQVFDVHARRVVDAWALPSDVARVTAIHPAPDGLSALLDAEALVPVESQVDRLFGLETEAEPLILLADLERRFAGWPLALNPVHPAVRLTYHSGGRQLERLDAQSGEPDLAFPGSAGQERLLWLDPRRHRVLSLAVRRAVQLWDVGTGDLIATVTWPGAMTVPTCAAALPGGDAWLVGQSDGTIMRLSLEEAPSP